MEIAELSCELLLAATVRLEGKGMAVVTRIEM